VANYRYRRYYYPCSWTFQKVTDRQPRYASYSIETDDKRAGVYEVLRLSGPSVRLSYSQCSTTTTNRRVHLSRGRLEFRYRTRRLAVVAARSKNKQKRTVYESIFDRSANESVFAAPAVASRRFSKKTVLACYTYRAVVRSRALMAADDRRTGVEFFIIYIICFRFCRFAAAPVDSVQTSS